MTKKNFRFLFGPVMSRRLGRSLGIDLLPSKTCTYDCLYCQVGVTSHKTMERKEYVPLRDVLAEVEEKLKEKQKPDTITLSGSGEPTLYSKIGELIRALKKQTNIPIAVLTNGSLLWDKDVQDALMEADLVIPSLDAGDEKSFKKVNQPHPDISFKKMVEGLVQFRRRFKKPIWLEVFLLKDMTALSDEVKKISSLVKKIRPDRIQLNTVARPTAQKSAVAVTDNDMERFCKELGPHAEVIASKPPKRTDSKSTVKEKDILDLLRRRPSAPEDIAKGLSISLSETMQMLDNLTQGQQVTCTIVNGKKFYTLI